MTPKVLLEEREYAEKNLEPLSTITSRYRLRAVDAVIISTTSISKTFHGCSWCAGSIQYTPEGYSFRAVVFRGRILGGLCLLVSHVALFLWWPQVPGSFEQQTMVQVTQGETIPTFEKVRGSSDLTKRRSRIDTNSGSRVPHGYALGLSQLYTLERAEIIRGKNHNRQRAA